MAAFALFDLSPWLLLGLALALVVLGYVGGTISYDDPNPDATKRTEDRAKKAAADYAAGFEPDWGELYRQEGEGLKPDRLQHEYGDLIAKWRQQKTKENYGWSTPELAWEAGIPEGPDAWAQKEADAWSARQAPEMWNAAGQRATRAGAQDALEAAQGGQLATDLQRKIAREAALQASAGRRQGGQAMLAGAQPGLAGAGMQAAIQERGARSAALGGSLKAGRQQEEAEAARLQDWTLKREALRQKLLGMGITGRNRRYDLLGQYIRDKQAQSMSELDMAQRESAASQAFNSGLVKSGADLLGWTMQQGKNQGDTSYDVPAETTSPEEQGYIDEFGNKYSDY